MRLQQQSSAPAPTQARWTVVPKYVLCSAKAESVGAIARNKDRHRHRRRVRRMAGGKRGEEQVEGWGRVMHVASCTGLYPAGTRTRSAWPSALARPHTHSHGSSSLPKHQPPPPMRVFPVAMWNGHGHLQIAIQSDVSKLYPCGTANSCIDCGVHLTTTRLASYGTYPDLLLAPNALPRNPPLCTAWPMYKTTADWLQSRHCPTILQRVSRPTLPPWVTCTSTLSYLPGLANKPLNVLPQICWPLQSRKVPTPFVALVRDQIALLFQDALDAHAHLLWED